MRRRNAPHAAHTGAAQSTHKIFFSPRKKCRSRSLSEQKRQAAPAVTTARSYYENSTSKQRSHALDVRYSWLRFTGAGRRPVGWRTWRRIGRWSWRRFGRRARFDGHGADERSDERYDRHRRLAHLALFVGQWPCARKCIGQWQHGAGDRRRAVGFGSSTRNRQRRARDGHADRSVRTGSGHRDGQRIRFGFG